MRRSASFAGTGIRFMRSRTFSALKLSSMACSIFGSLLSSTLTCDTSTVPGSPSAASTRVLSSTSIMSVSLLTCCCKISL